MIEIFKPKIEGREKAVWQTAEGRKLPMSKISHQHLSNIYWYNKVFSTDIRQRNCKHRMEFCMRFAEHKIKELYQGKILSWKPVYKYEKIWLEELNSLKENNILFEGCKIGELDQNLI